MQLSVEDSVRLPIKKRLSGVFVSIKKLAFRKFYVTMGVTIE